jgi:hypothetical protein
MEFIVIIAVRMKVPQYYQISKLQFIFPLSFALYPFSDENNYVYSYQI